MFSVFDDVWLRLLRVPPFFLYLLMPVAFKRPAVDVVPDRGLRTIAQQNYMISQSGFFGSLQFLWYTFNTLHNVLNDRH